MGKNLHYSIKPFIEKALENHFSVSEIQLINIEDYYAYNIIRKRGLSNLIIVLSDDYYFDYKSLQSKPEILKEGGFFLIAKPEAKITQDNIPIEKIAVGKLGKLLGALNQEDFWNYEPPENSK